MKICFVAYHTVPLLVKGDLRPFGGAEYQQFLLGRELLARGHTIIYIVVNLPPHAESDFRLIEAYDEDRGVPVLRFFWPRLTGLWRALKEADADAYYQRGAGFLTGITAHFCRLRKRPFVFGIASDSDCDPKLGWPNRWIDKRAYRYGLRHADRVLTQQINQNDLLQRNYGVQGGTVQSLTAPRRASDGPSSGRSVVWIGSMRKKKQPDLFLDLAGAMPEATFHMIGGPVGSEPEEYSLVEKRADTIQNLQFHGFKPLEETEEILSRASLLVNTSRTEGFPNVFLQAWSYGIPVVALADWPGVIEKLELGRICSEPNRLADVVSVLLDDEPLRKRLGRNGLKYVIDNHSPSVIADFYEELFEGLVGRGRRARGSYTGETRGA